MATDQLSSVRGDRGSSSVGSEVSKQRSQGNWERAGVFSLLYFLIGWKWFVTVKLGPHDKAKRRVQNRDEMTERN